MLTIKIKNDKTGVQHTGNYDVQISDGQSVIWKGKIEGFDRRLGWRRLLAAVLDEIK